MYNILRAALARCQDSNLVGVKIRRIWTDVLFEQNFTISHPEVYLLPTILTI